MAPKRKRTSTDTGSKPKKPKTGSSKPKPGGSKGGKPKPPKWIKTKVPVNQIQSKIRLLGNRVRPSGRKTCPITTVGASSAGLCISSAVLCYGYAGLVTQGQFRRTQGFIYVYTCNFNYRRVS